MPQMDYPAALHRIQLGLPATVEHASGGTETAQAVAETTQVCLCGFTEFGMKLMSR